MMLRLNIRHALPQTAQRSTPNRLESAAVFPARLHGNFQQPTTTRGATQPVTEIDNYPSRRAWGARNMTDFTREYGQKGFADLQEATSKHTQDAWRRATGGAKPGGDIAQQIYQEMFAKYSAVPVAGISTMEGPRFYVTPSELVGSSEQGHLTTEVETTPFPAYSYTPGGAETYMKNEGFIRRWVTMDEYDIYA